MINAKTDGNHAEIRAKTRQAGYDWTDTFRLGKGEPDAIVAGIATWAPYPVAVKIEIKRKGKGKLRESQKDYIKSLKHPDNYIVVEDETDIFRWFGR